MRLRKNKNWRPPNQSMLGVALSNFPARHMEREVFEDMFVYKNLMLCRTYGHRHKPISLLIMNWSNPKFFHVVLFLAVVLKGEAPKSRPPRRDATYLPSE